MALIVIDPGHGGAERIGGSSPNNATGPNGLLEKDLTLDLGLRLAESLPRGGNQVTLTRDSDVNLSLEDRAAVAANAEADAFVSIHLNGFDNPAVQGTEVFHHNEAAFSSRMLADDILAFLVQATGLRNRGVRMGGLGVLRPDRHHPGTAACLIEVSFLTEPEEAGRLERDDYLQLVATSIDLGIRRFLLEREQESPQMLLAAPQEFSEGCFG